MLQPRFSKKIEALLFFVFDGEILYLCRALHKVVHRK